MSLEEWSSPDLFFTTDSNLTGFGGWNPYTKEYFKGLFPEFVLSATGHINQLELVTILFACRYWSKDGMARRFYTESSAKRKLPSIIDIPSCHEFYAALRQVVSAVYSKWIINANGNYEYHSN